MKRGWRGGMAALLAVLLLVVAVLPASAEAALISETENHVPSLDLAAKSVVLMDATTGSVLYEQNADEALPPASVTKVMTLLLIAEAIDGGRIKLRDMVTVSEHAASMGGSQIYLEPGENMSVEDLFKSVVMASANDAACALAEHIYGSESAFVAKMNEKAASLGMQNTHFENTNGLDDTTVNHVTSARDIAIMSRALLSHTFVLDYTTLWMDTIRDGAFTLANTNRLVRFYPGCTGLKTGSTAKAKFCISASAKRDGMHLIAVIMGAETRDIRNEEAKKLLDFGFANFSLYRDEGKELPKIPVVGGAQNSCKVEYTPWVNILDKGQNEKISVEYSMAESIEAPISAGTKVGSVKYKCGEKLLAECDIKAAEDVEKISFGEVFRRIFLVFLGG